MKSACVGVLSIIELWIMFNHFVMFSNKQTLSTINAEQSILYNISFQLLTYERHFLN